MQPYIVMLIMIANVGSHYLTSFSIVLCGHVVLTFYVLCTYLKHSHSVLMQLCDVSTLKPVTKLLLLLDVCSNFDCLTAKTHLVAQLSNFFLFFSILCA